MTVGQERERRCIQVATLDKVAYPQIDQHRRVYSIDAVSPTIPTCGGGGTQPNILVIGQLPGYEKNGRIYDPRGISPSVQSRDYKDAAKIVVGGD